MVGFFDTLTTQEVVMDVNDFLTDPEVKKGVSRRWTPDTPLTPLALLARPRRYFGEHKVTPFLTLQPISGWLSPRKGPSPNVHRHISTFIGMIQFFLLL